MLEHITALNPDDFLDLEEADTPSLLSAQAGTAEFLASLGSPNELITQDEMHNARTAFATVTNPEQSEAERRAAILALKTPPAVQHLAGMLSQYDWAYVDQAKELRGYVVAKLLEETKHPDARIRLRALELTGKLTEVASFTERSEVIHKNESADELEARIRAKLASMTKGLPALQTVQDVEPHQPDAGQ